MYDVMAFRKFADNHPHVWRYIEGQRIHHSKFGGGEILEVCGEHPDNLTFLVQFDQEAETLSGITDKVRIGKTAFNGIIISAVTLPDSIIEEVARVKSEQEAARERRRIQEARLQAQAEKQRQQREREAKARLEFRERKKRYHVESYADDSPVSPLNQILIRLDDNGELTFEDEVWLTDEGLYAVLAIWHERAGRWASAGSNWRKAKRPERALEISEGMTDNHRVLTMRGGAFRDLGQLSAAEQSANQAIALAPDDYHPHNLLGAVYYQRGMPQQGDLHFEKAEQLGSQPGYTERNIRSAVDRASNVDRRKVAEYLLAKDAVKYEWARYYLRKGAF